MILNSETVINNRYLFVLIIIYPNYKQINLNYFYINRMNVSYFFNIKKIIFLFIANFLLYHMYITDNIFIIFY